MTQEFIDLRTNILAGRYDDALAIIDELEGMSKQTILRNIESFLVRLIIHLIKNQVEKRLTNSWAASISNSVRQIQKLNLKDNKKSYYIQENEWQLFLEEAILDAVRPASAEVQEGKLTPSQLAEKIDRNEIIIIAQQLLSLTYSHQPSDLLELIDQALARLSGGKDWYEGS